MTVHFPETHTREYFTTARIIHDTTDRELKSKDWVWINTNSSHQFVTREGAQNIANLSNDNGRESGLDIDNFPYFVVKVTQASKVERVELNG